MEDNAISLNNNENKEKKNDFHKEIKKNFFSEIVRRNRTKLYKKTINIPTKILSPKKKEPIKVKQTPTINRNESRDNNDQSKLNYTCRNENTFENIHDLLYLSSPQEKSFDSNTIHEIKMNKKINCTVTRNNIKDNKKFSTPYRRINIKSKRETLSPSANVIIKNFNYNNVYNINIDNDNKKNTKKDESDKKNNNNKSNNKSDLNRFTHKYITYNKPKTTSNMNFQSSFSKKNIQRNIYIDNIINKNSNKKNGTFYSRFISEGKFLKNPKDNFIINSTFEGNNYKPYKTNTEKKLGKTHTHSKNKNNNFDSNYDTDDINDNSSYSYKFNLKGINNFSNKSKLSLKTTYNTPKANSPYINKTEISPEKPNIISFNLNDLNLFQEKINNIIMKFNDNKKGEFEVYNDCQELLNFYSKSSIKGSFTSFFKDNNKLIIESSINLALFSIIIIYHLSKNKFLTEEIIKIINDILFLSKINFSLYMKKIQINYKINITKKNFIYFQTYNNFLNQKNITNIENEVDITFTIYQNCKQMTIDIKKIMEYYKSINAHYYNNFIKIFNNISIQNENELINYFNTKVVKRINTTNIIPVDKNEKKSNINKYNFYNEKPKAHILKRNKTNISIGFFSPNKKKSIFENLSIKRGTNKFKKPIVSSLKKETISKPKKIGIPYIKSPTNKKYTLVLDLNKTLAYYDIESGKIKLRNGLFSFLSMVKTYYELISFSCEPINITEAIIKDIERENKYFDYNLNRTHSILYENYLVKDISLIGRDISKIIIIDNDENCFKLNKENGIKITSFNDRKDDDNKLFELKKILILIFKKNYDDVREALKDFSEDIKTKLSLA